ncbi:MAG: hypothetical protein FJ108_07300 [Deltaproteobacteria bacterium]|nr:hypothetical protein [Deltaproteobacteria bacterium]
MARYLVALLAVVWVGYAVWDARPIARSPGVLAPGEPVQQNLTEGPHWRLGGYDVQALARFELEARVLSAERYRFDREAELAPVDLALGWGPMSANAVIDTLDISQGGRFFHWWSREPMIAPGEISRHSANMHMVPLDDDVRATLLDARRGNLVRLAGWLIEARASDGWKWRSSLSRGDSGAGACELVLVERVELD